jgi:hypothetical protein
VTRVVGKVRDEVFARDGGCVARRIDPDAGPCFDRWGRPMMAYDLAHCEMDFVRHGSRGRHHELPADHLTLCPGHHRGAGASAGYVWATVAAHRIAARQWLNAEGWKGK